MNAVLPLEETDPLLAEHLRKIANREHPVVRGIEMSWHTRQYHLWDGRVEVRTSKPPGRNDACPCGSGVKYKKCCGR